MVHFFAFLLHFILSGSSTFQLSLSFHYLPIKSLKTESLESCPIGKKQPNTPHITYKIVLRRFIRFRD